jgi:hypothetical protein
MLLWISFSSNAMFIQEHALHDLSRYLNNLKKFHYFHCTNGSWLQRITARTGCRNKIIICTCATCRGCYPRALVTKEALLPEPFLAEPLLPFDPET